MDGAEEPQINSASVHGSLAVIQSPLQGLDPPKDVAEKVDPSVDHQAKASLPNYSFASQTH